MSNVIPLHPDAAGLVISGDVEVRPDVFVKVRGIPLDLTVGELKRVSESIAQALLEYSQMHGYNL